MSQVLEILSGLSNDRCPRDMYIPYTRTLCWCVCVRTYRRGLRVVGSIRLGNATALKRGTTIVGLHAFFVFIYLHVDD